MDQVYIYTQTDTAPCSIYFSTSSYTLITPATFASVPYFLMKFFFTPCEHYLSIGADLVYRTSVHTDDKHKDNMARAQHPQVIRKSAESTVVVFYYCWGLQAPITLLMTDVVVKGATIALKNSGMYLRPYGPSPMLFGLFFYPAVTKTSWSLIYGIEYPPYSPHSTRLEWMLLVYYQGHCPMINGEDRLTVAINSQFRTPRFYFSKQSYEKIILDPVPLSPFLVPLSTPRKVAGTSTFVVFNSVIVRLQRDMSVDASFLDPEKCKLMSRMIAKNSAAFSGNSDLRCLSFPTEAQNYRGWCIWLYNARGLFSWNQANAICQKQHGQLVQTKSRHMVEFVKSRLWKLTCPECIKPVFIGLRRKVCFLSDH